MKPKVSVIVTAYKRPQYMDALMAGLFNQTLSDWECIIVDDGSDMQELTDICRRYEQQDKRVRYIYQQNSGVAAARNRGIAEASAEFIAFNDDDDISQPQRLAKQIEFLQQHPQVAAVGCYISQINHAGELTSHLYSESAAPCIAESNPPNLHVSMDMRTPCINATSCCRRECLIEVGGFCVDYLSAEDTDLTLRIIEKFSLGMLPQSLYFVRGHDEPNLSRDVMWWKYYAAAYVSAYYRRNHTAKTVDDNLLNLIFDIHLLPEETIAEITKKARSSAKQFLRAKEYEQLKNMLDDFNKAFSFSRKHRQKMYRNMLAWSIGYGKFKMLPYIIKHGQLW